MGKLGKRVDLVHELRKLAAAEELLDRRHNRLDRDEVLRLDRTGLQVHAFLGNALHAGESTLQCILQKLANRTDTPVAQMVDIVDVLFTDEYLDQEIHRIDDILRGENGQVCGSILLFLFGTGSELLVELVTADRTEIIAAI